MQKNITFTFIFCSFYILTFFASREAYSQCNPYGAWNLTFIKGKEKIEGVTVNILEKENSPELSIPNLDKRYKGKLMESKCMLEFKDTEDDSILSLQINGEKLTGEEIDMLGKVTGKVNGKKEANIFKIIDEVYNISASKYLPVEFNVSEKSKIIIGFNVLGGGKKDIKFYLLDELNFFKMKAQENFYTEINIDKSTTSYNDIIDLNPAKYYVILDNRFSVLSDKKVNLKIYKMEKTKFSKSFPVSLNEVCYDSKSKFYRKYYDEIYKLYKKCEVNDDYRSDYRPDSICKVLFGNITQIEEDRFNKTIIKLKDIDCEEFINNISAGNFGKDANNIFEYIERKMP